MVKIRKKSASHRPSAALQCFNLLIFSQDTPQLLHQATATDLSSTPNPSHSAAPASKDPLDLQDLPEMMARTVKMETKEKMETLERTEELSPQTASRASPASSALLVPLDHQETPEPRDLKDPAELPDFPESMGVVESLVWSDQLDQWESLECQDPRERRETMDTSSTSTDPQDHLVPPDLGDARESRDPRDALDPSFLDLRDLLETKERRDVLDARESLECRDHLDRRDPMAIASTAPLLVLLLVTEVVASKSPNSG